MKTLVMFIAFTMMTFSFAQEHSSIGQQCRDNFSALYQNRQTQFLVAWNGEDCSIEARPEFVTCSRLIRVPISDSCQSDTKTVVSNIQLDKKLTVVQITDLTAEDDHNKCDVNVETVFQCAKADNVEEANFIVARIYDFNLDSRAERHVSRSPAIIPEPSIAEEDRSLIIKEEEDSIEQEQKNSTAKGE